MSKLKYNLPFKRSDYVPEVAEFLNSLPDEYTYYQKYDAVHPVDIYMLQLSLVIKRCKALTERYLKIIDEYKTKPEVEIKLSENIELLEPDILNFLNSIANLIDSCNLVLKTLFDVDAKKDTSKKVNAKFLKSISNYQKNIGHLVNDIKHNNGQLSLFSATWGNTNILVGYFVRGAIGKDAMGPNPKIHERYNNMSTGFSLNRDIPYHLIHIYYISARLLQTLTDTYQNELIKDIFDPGEESKQMLELLKLVASIPREYLPDELHKSEPYIKVNGKKVILSFGYEKKATNRSVHQLTMTTHCHMLRKSKSVVPPYLMG